jgi:hypothetical protein
VNRVNFAADQVGNLEHPGIQDIVDRIVARGARQSPEELVDSCLDLVGPLVVGEETRRALVGKAGQGGEAVTGNREHLAQRVTQMLQLIVATREFQFA